MKRLPVFCVVAVMALNFSQSLRAQGNPEANKIAREASEAAKNQDWENAVEGFRKAAGMDHKYTTNLVAALQQRATAYINDQRFAEALTDLTEAIRHNPREAGIYERRAYVEMKGSEYDKALADYSEAIKLRPNEVRYYLLRGYIYETKGDIKNSMADTEKALKLQPKNPEALGRKARLQTIQRLQAAQAPAAPPPPKR